MEEKTVIHPSFAFHLVRGIKVFSENHLSENIQLYLKKKEWVK